MLEPILGAILFALIIISPFLFANFIKKASLVIPHMIITFGSLGLIYYLNLIPKGYEFKPFHGIVILLCSLFLAFILGSTAKE